MNKMKRNIAYLICTLSTVQSFCFGEGANTKETYFVDEQGLRVSKYLHGREINAVAISPDGKVAAVVVHDTLQGRGFIDYIQFTSLDGTDSEILNIFPEGDGGMTQIHHMTFSPDGKYLAFEDIGGGSVSMFQIWDVFGHKRVFEIEPSGVRKSGFEFLNDTGYIIVSCGSYMSKSAPTDAEVGNVGIIRIYNFLKGTEEKSFMLRAYLCNYYRLSPDGHYWAGSGVGGDQRILILDTKSGKIHKQYPEEGMKPGAFIEGFTFSNDGKSLVIATPIFPKTGGRASGRRIETWKFEEGQIVSSFEVDDTFDLQIMNLSKDGKRLYMSGAGCIHVYDISEHKTFLNTTPIRPGRQLPVCFNTEHELIAFGTPYGSHKQKELRCLLVCDLTGVGGQNNNPNQRVLGTR
jgi:WD40 repeat protein